MENSKKNTAASRMVSMAVLTALALIFSYVETLIPLNFGIPGVKPGLANLIVVVGLFLLRPGDVLLVSVVRIILSGFLFGNAVSILYSLTGGVLSFLVMLLMAKKSPFSVLGISAAGGVTHNMGQLLIASLILQSARIAYYIPVLMIAGTLTGTVMGLLSGQILSRLRRAVVLTA